MNRSERVTVVLVGILAWAGLGPLGAPMAAAADRSATGGDRIIRESGTLQPAEWVEIRNKAGRALPVLSVEPQGKTVKKGDLVVELDASALIEERIRQVQQCRKAEANLIDVNESLSREEKTARVAVAMAEKALAVAQGQLKVYAEGEHPHELALAEATAGFAGEKHTMAKDRVAQVQAKFGANKDEEVRAALMQAMMMEREAALHAAAAEGKLALLKGFLHSQKMAELDLLVAQKTSELALAKDTLIHVKAKGRSTVALAQIDSRMEADRLARLDDQISRCKSYAPGDGAVFYGSGAFKDDTGEALSVLQPGAVIRPAQVMIRFADTKWWTVEVGTTLPVAQQLVPGRSARIHIDALPGRTFKGHVSRARVETQWTKPGVITVRIDDPSGDPRVGMTATVEFDPLERPEDPAK